MQRRRRCAAAAALLAVLLVAPGTCFEQGSSSSSSSSTNAGLSSSSSRWGLCSRLQAALRAALGPLGGLGRWPQQQQQQQIEQPQQSLLLPGQQLPAAAPPPRAQLAPARPRRATAAGGGGGHVYYSSEFFSSSDFYNSSSSDLFNSSSNSWRERLFGGRSSASSRRLAGRGHAKRHKYFDTSRSRWHRTVMHSAFRAMNMLRSTAEERAERVFVPMLSSRHAQLCCMLTDLNAKVGHTNAIDVYIFTVDNAAEAVFKRSPCWRREFALNIIFLPLEEHWGVPAKYATSAITDRSGWVGMPGLFSENYRRMGHWRLTFQFAFADLLGYKFLWQLDDDSEFRSPLDFSMVDYMRERDLWVAGARTLPDPAFVTWGLPEITRLFLVGERLEPPGTLFTNHTVPPGLRGLYTVVNDTGAGREKLEGDEGGWSRAIIHGNCIIFDLERFWWPRQHQRFVELVVQSGYHWRFRWNEQGVYAMLWQVFVPAGHFEFDTLPIDFNHPRKVWGSCP